MHPVFAQSVEPVVADEGADGACQLARLGELKQFCLKANLQRDESPIELMIVQIVRDAAKDAGGMAKVGVKCNGNAGRHFDKCSKYIKINT